jgi:hypothetical protein
MGRKREKPSPSCQLLAAKLQVEGKSEEKDAPNMSHKYA